MTDSWEDDAWEADDGPDRDDVLRLARQLAEQRARQRVHDLAELDELKRTLRERAARASEAVTADQELAGERERLAALQADLQERERAVAQVEENSKTQREGDNQARDSEPFQRETEPRALAARLAAREAAAPLKRNAELAQRETELRTLETRLAEREADVLRMQTALAAREEELRRRERELDDAQRLSERAAAIPLEPYLSFSEGLESLAGRSDRHWP